MKKYGTDHVYITLPTMNTEEAAKRFPNIFDACMEEELEQSQTELIQKLLIKKRYDSENATREERAKIYRFLLQRGFSSSDISRVLRDCDTMWD